MRSLSRPLRPRSKKKLWRSLTSPPEATQVISQLDELVVRLGPTITKELPRVAHFANLVEVELSGDQLSLVARCSCEELSAWIAEVALTVELTNIPGLFVPNAIDCADEVRIGHCMGRLLELPQIL